MLTEIKKRMVRTLYNTGETYEEYSTVDDEYHGEYKAWYKDGDLEEHCVYEHDKMHGEQKSWWDARLINEHYICKHNKYHGEQKEWDHSGNLITHKFRCNDNNITDEVEALVQDITNITEEEKLLIKLTWGIPCLS